MCTLARPHQCYSMAATYHCVPQPPASVRTQALIIVDQTRCFCIQFQFSLLSVSATWRVSREAGCQLVPQRRHAPPQAPLVQHTYPPWPLRALATVRVCGTDTAFVVLLLLVPFFFLQGSLASGEVCARRQRLLVWHGDHGWAVPGAPQPAPAATVVARGRPPPLAAQQLARRACGLRAAHAPIVYFWSRSNGTTMSSGALCSSVMSDNPMEGVIKLVNKLQVRS